MNNSDKNTNKKQPLKPHDQCKKTCYCCWWCCFWWCCFCCCCSCIM